MRVKYLAALFFIFSMVSFTGFASPAGDVNERFEQYKSTFLEQLWRTYPTWASTVGYHTYDNVLVVPDEQSRQRELAFCQNLLLALGAFPVNELNDGNKTDYYMIENQLRSTEWTVKELRAWEWDPTSYNLSGTFAEMLGNEYAPLDDRLKNFSERMTYVPDYYKAAKANIKNPTKEHTELAIEQLNGGLSVFEMDLGAAVAKSTLPNEEKAKIKKRASESIAAIKSFIDWLEKLDNKTPRSFRLGADLYAKKFSFDLQSRFTAKEVYDRAVARKKELHGKMYEVTTRLWSKYYKTAMPTDSFAAISQMISRLSEEHVAPAEFQAAIEKQIPELVAFVKKKNLLYIDPSKPLVVRREPAYMAGVAGASISAPGPYDKEGNTYYNVGSLDGWDSARAESYLREYNKYILQILNIHEAIPGHYTQLVYANQSPSLIKSVLGNNAMIEGWAVYTELMMLENGYGARPLAPTPDAPPEMWLMYYKWNLRSTCNTILDYSVHAGTMDKAGAMKLLVDEAFQQQAEADGKWRRVSVTQVQLCCYFTGFTEICALREEVKKKEGAKFSLKKFHEQFLSYGSAPVKHIRSMMLK